ncbi:MAG: nicotinate-nucleotide adenylyltransferase [Bacillota bacterium]|nr:nicotinate-nucleotide adenylyltransferase [Bacillota bacterium]
MRKKAIFGGTFDPIHNGHMNVAYEALYKFNLDQVIFMPTGNPPHKVDKIITDAGIRFQMVKDAIKHEGKFAVSDYEIKKNGLSYTYETLGYFNNLEPDTQWYFVTGVDCLLDIGIWRNVEEILRLSKFVVFNRPGYEMKDILAQKKKVEDMYKTEILFLDLPLLDISSTDIRKRVSEDKNVAYLVPHEAYKNITRLKLYKEG